MNILIENYMNRNLKTQTQILFILILLTINLLSCASKRKEKPDLSLQQYNVATYYWPAYHDDPRWRKFFINWYGNEGEWEIIRNSVPKYKGHRQPRVPLWGYEDESNPEVMEKN